MSVLKVVELMANSKQSWEDATTKAVKKASKTISDIKSAYVKDQSVVVKDGEVVEFRVTLKVTFEVK